jgi:internalin A
MHDELLQLMMRFKLCYEIPHRPKTYIAPQLLSPNQPEYDWDDTNNLILRYQYEFMPKGMLTRFIVEMHKLIDGDLVWKEGVILKDENARAEVIEAYYKNEIRIRIAGKLKKPLLENIRHEFRKIHDSYNKPEDPSEKHRLRYQEFIPCNCSVCKGSQTPHDYPLSELQERLRNQKYETECNRPPYQKVNVHSLIDDALGQNYHIPNPNIEITYGKEYEDVLDLAKRIADRPINNIVKVNAMTNQPQKINNFNAPMSGVIASDNAQVSNNQFTQNNNANMAELFQLIAAMRQNAALFPKEIQDDVIIDIDDVEIEIQKPESDRNLPRLKKRLLALATAGSLMAAPIAGMTDFVNNATDLADKIGIELL